MLNGDMTFFDHQRAKRFQDQDISGSMVYCRSVSKQSWAPCGQSDKLPVILSDSDVHLTSNSTCCPTRWFISVCIPLLKSSPAAIYSSLSSSNKTRGAGKHRLLRAVALWDPLGVKQVMAKTLFWIPYRPIIIIHCDKFPLGHSLSQIKSASAAHHIEHFTESSTTFCNILQQPSADGQKNIPSHASKSWSIAFDDDFGHWSRPWYSALCTKTVGMWWYF